MVKDPAEPDKSPSNAAKPALPDATIRDAGRPKAVQSDAETETETETEGGAQPVAELASSPAQPAKPPRRVVPSGSQLKTTVRLIRTWIASAVWLIALTGAIILSVGALLVALKANTDNVLVGWVLDAAREIDGPFWKVFDFYKETSSGKQGAPDEVKNHLVNWGLAAVAYLVVGRLLDRIIRPAS